MQTIRELSAQVVLADLNYKKAITYSAQSTALDAWSDALTALAARPAIGMDEIRMKSVALATCAFPMRGEPVRMEGDCGLTFSLVQDLARL